MAKLQKTFTKNVLTLLGDKSRLWLGNQTGISSGTLSTTLSEDGNATLKTVERIAEALGVTADVLLKEEQGEIPPDILNSLHGQSPAVYDSIRTILKTIAVEKSNAHQKKAIR